MDCGGIPELGYGEFSKWIRAKTAGKRVPLSGSIELTHRCNLRCVHCYLDGHHTPPPDQQEMTTEEIFGIIDQIVAEGCLWLLLTGGEPLLREDWKEIYLYAKRKGMILTLFTNGTLITEEDAEFLAKWRPFAVEISVYGASREVYEKVTRAPGSFDRCMQGIANIIDEDIPLRLKTVAMKPNASEVEDLRHLARALGTEFRYDTVLKPCTDGRSDPLTYSLSPEDVIALESADAERSYELTELFSERFAAVEGNSLFLCGAGETSFHIDPYGSLSLCMTARLPAYDLRGGSFHVGWTGCLRETRNMTASAQYRCIGCEMRLLCQQCPALAQLLYGDPNRAVDYLCEITHLRKHTFWSKVSV